MVSFIRLMQRRKVDLPQPDGPMKAVTSLVAMSISTSNSACFGPYQRLTLRVVTLGSGLVEASVASAEVAKVELRAWAITI